MKLLDKRILDFNNLMRDYVSEDFKTWLLENRFFDKPASLSYHGAYSGGLFDHSLAVTKKLLDITKRFNLQWQNERSPYIVGMFHDLCKIDNYKFEVEVDTITTWKKNENVILSGHGEKSVMMLSQWYRLTEEEVLCIRYHMGAYETKDWEQFDKAIRRYETVLWTHTADMYASKVHDV